MDGMIVRTKERIEMRERVQSVLLSKVERIASEAEVGERGVGNVM